MTENSQLTTTHAGDSNVGSGGKGETAGIAIAFTLVLLVALPASVLISAVAYFYAIRNKVRPRVLVQFAAGLTAVFVLLGGLLIKSFFVIPDAVKNVVKIFKNTTDTPPNITPILQTLPASIVVGLFIASFLAYLSYSRRPKWIEIKYKLTPFEWLRKQRTIKDIQSDQKTPLTGATLGINDKGQRIIQTDKESSAHTLIFGASGSGKTTTMMTKIRDLMKRKQGIIIIDLKGGNDFPELIYDYATRYGRGFKHFLFQDPRLPYDGPAPDGPAYWDSIGRGDASRRMNMVISMRQWSEDYYKTIASDYLQTAFDVMIAVPAYDQTDAISDIMRLLDPENLAERAKHLPKDQYSQEIYRNVQSWTNRTLTREEKSSIEGIQRELSVLRSSTAGQWLRKSNDQNRMISLLEAAHNGDAIVFSLDSLTYPQSAPLVGNLIIEDLKTLTGELTRNPAPNPCNVFIDEFSSLESNSILGLISKSRSGGLPITLATQALGDLRSVNMSFLDQLLGIASSFVVHRANTMDDATALAGLIGPAKKWKQSINIEHDTKLFGLGKGSATGSGSVNEVDGYVVEPEKIQELKAGEMYYLATNPNRRVEHIQVIPENQELTGNTRRHAPPLTNYEPQASETLFSHNSLPPAPTVPTHPTPASPPTSTQNPNTLPPHHFEPGKRSTGFLGGRNLKEALGGELSAPSTQPQHEISGTTDPPPAPVSPQPTPTPAMPALPRPIPTQPSPPPTPTAPSITKPSPMPLPTPGGALPLPTPVKPVPAKPPVPVNDKGEWNKSRW